MCHVVCLFLFFITCRVVLLSGCYVSKAKTRQPWWWGLKTSSSKHSSLLSFPSLLPARCSCRFEATASVGHPLMISLLHPFLPFIVCMLKSCFYRVVRFRYSDRRQSATLGARSQLVAIARLWHSSRPENQGKHVDGPLHTDWLDNPLPRLVFALLTIVTCNV